MTDQNVDEVKGRVEEAAGDLTDDQDLKNEGKVDQGKSTLKDAVDKVGEGVKSLFGRGDKK